MRLLGALMLCAAAAAAAAVTPGVPRARFGIVAFDFNGRTPEALATLGVGLVRGSCGWSDLEPSRGVFDWRCADGVIVNAERRGLRTYMTVNCTPRWAQPAGCAALPADVADWYDFVAHFVARYSGTRTILGVWNEPNLTLADDPTGDGYALLFANASNARNRIDPAFVLAAPDTSHHALQDGYFAHVVDAITAAHAWNPQDVLAVHWYPDGPPLADYLDAVNRIGRAREVWLSETGASSANPDLQARLVGDVLDLFTSDTRPWWTHVVFYRLWDGTDCCTDAVVRADFSPKRAFDVLRQRILEARRGHDPRVRDTMSP